MNLDDLIATWRTQDEEPLYGVNRDLLQLVLQHEQADLRRELRWEQAGVYAVSAVLFALSTAALAAVWYDDDPRTPWDYVAAGISAAAVLGWAVAVGLSRKRQALRERGFGNSLQAEIRRNLSLVDYQLSLAGRRDSALLMVAPILVASTLLYWLIIQINNNPFGWYDVGVLAFIVVGPTLWGAVSASRERERELLPRRQRLSELLETLNASE